MKANAVLISETTSGANAAVAEAVPYTDECDHQSRPGSCDAWGHPYPQLPKQVPHICSSDCEGCASRARWTIEAATS